MHNIATICPRKRGMVGHHYALRTYFHELSLLIGPPDIITSLAPLTGRPYIIALIAHSDWPDNEVLPARVTFWHHDYTRLVKTQTDQFQADTNGSGTIDLRISINETIGPETHRPMQRPQRCWPPIH